MNFLSAENGGENKPNWLKDFGRQLTNTLLGSLSNGSKLKLPESASTVGAFLEQGLYLVDS